MAGCVLQIWKSLQVFKKYQYLLRQLVARDFKVKYKRSVLGVAWSVLNPLLTMIILNIVFSQLFNMRGGGAVKDYPVYLLTGIVIFNYFSEATNLSNGAVVTNFNLITKVYIPKYIFPMSKVLSSALNLLFSLIALYLIVVIEAIRTHVAPSPAGVVSITWVQLLLPYDLLCIVLFCVGLGMLLSALTVFFRDMFYIWGVVLTAWMYLTPIIYPESILDKSRFKPMMEIFFHVNPLYYFVNFARSLVVDNVVPTPWQWASCMICALVMLAVGCSFFHSKQDKFIYYI